MIINVNLEDMNSCKDCGIVFDKTLVKTKKRHYDVTIYICPVCKKEMYVDEYTKVI